MPWRRLIAAAALFCAAAAASALALGGTVRAEAAGLPPCVHPHRAHAALPASLAQLPLPAGTVLDRKRLAYGYAIYSGYVPGAINPVRDFLVSRLPAAGFHLGAGDAEAAEAEAAWSGRGVRGRGKVQAVYGCPGALTTQIAVR